MQIEKIRVSIGSASVLGLSNNTFKIPPTNCYLMTFIQGHCIANCGFCPQSRESDSSTEKLSRINWPVYSFKEFLTKLKYLPPSKKFERICIQTLNYPENFRDLREIIIQIKKISNIPISMAVPPMAKVKLKELKAMGVQRVGIALDGATAEVFERVKGEGVNGPYSWKTHFQCLKDALEIFPDRFVTTHIIIGLGETEKELMSLFLDLKGLKINVSLFAFTPIKGTKFENLVQPEIINFRKMQIVRHLILNENKILEDFVFNQEGNLIKININRKELENIINNTNAFLTSGCPGCNRPFYTSRPSGPIFNYPRELKDREKEEIYNLLINYVN